MIIFAVTVPYEGMERLFTTREAAEAFIAADPWWGKIGAYVESVPVYES